MAAAASRLSRIDHLRGAFMIAIVCAHGLANVEPGHRIFLETARHLLSAKIGFTVVSGTLVGWFAVVKRDRFDRVARRYLVQAARFVLVIHPLIAVALFAPVGVPFATYLGRTLFITDVLAILFVAVVPWVPRLAPRARLVAGIALLGLDLLAGVVVPDGGLAGLVHQLLTSTKPDHALLVSTYSLLAIAGCFLIGTWLGDRLARARDERVFARDCLRWAAWLVALSGGLVLAWTIARRAGWADVARVLYPDYSTTLVPIYLAETLLAFALVGKLDATHPLVRAIELVGKTSLFVFVVQYALVQTLPYALGWQHAMSPVEWIALDLGALALLVVAARGWNHWVKHA